ncbi:MAG: hypothetical protein V1717_02590 [Candidatus Micrarchaeota archaeon]
MLLKKLELQNIRSYSDASVEFPDGVVLFEGDVGSGKSTVLYAIEFALFGLGDLNASFLLRNSAQSGSVKLDFQVGGKDYSVFRSLEKKKTVQQGECYVVENGAKALYTPSEMKPAVLKILGFKEPPNPRAQSIIYRYAVFTPQEEMKKILEDKPEERLQTLRKAFRVEDYRIARDNAAVVLKGLREEARFLEGQASDLPRLEEEEKQSRDKKLVLERDLGEAVSKAAVSEEALAKAKKAFSELQTNLASFRSLQAELPLLKKRLEEKKASLSDCAEQKELSETEALDLKQQVSEIKIADVDYTKTQDAYRKIKTQASELTNEIGGLQVKQKDYSMLKEKGVCPTCNQAIAGDFEKHAAELARVVLEKRNALEKLRAEEDDLALLLEQAVQQNALKQRKGDLEKRLEKNNSDLRSYSLKLKVLQDEIPSLEKTLAEKQASFELLKGSEEKAGALEVQVQKAEAGLKALLSQKTRVETQLQDCAQCLEDLGTRISEKTLQKRKLAVLSERKVWLEGHFIPCLSAIETHVLAGLNREFDLQFKKWFSLLVESQDLSVSAGEQFDPLVEINGYEHSYLTLSGGEKSALALAYRLALNVMVKSVSASLSENLVILDEPTDGFSKEQLGKVRGVLNELNAKQVLLVSHERELEAFADKVFFVSKKDGLSVIS